MTLTKPRLRIVVCLLYIGASGCGDDTSGGDAATDTARDAVAEAEGRAPDVVDTTEAPEIDSSPATETVTEVVVAEVEDVVEVEVTPPAEPSILLTIADIPASMNGMVPSVDPPLTWRLRANRARLDLDVRPLAGSGPIDDVTVTCRADDVPHTLPAVLHEEADHWQVRIDEASAFPDGAAVACEAAATGPGGNASSSVVFDAATLPPKRDPFPATDEWLVVLSRDIFDLQVIDEGGGTASLRSDYIAGGNGTLDFDEPFVELGLFSTEHPEAAAKVKAHLLDKIRHNVYAFYGLTADGSTTRDGVAIRIYFEGDPGAPDASAYGGERRFSMIALGGDGEPSDQTGGFFGRAEIDWNNQDTEDDTVYGLGVFPTALVRQILKQPLGAILLADYRPSQGGVAFGDDPNDDLFIGKDLVASDLPPGSGRAGDRIEIYNLLVKFGALALSSILAHEIGHSLGLVPYGVPPKGLFAGVDVDFVVSVAPDAHIDTPGLNIMQTGGSVNWVEAVGGAMPRFEPLSWAYLTRQLVVGDNP